MFITRSFRRFTRLLCLALALAALLPGASMTPTAAAQVSTVPDMGDAPDSTNALGLAMHAYPGVTARFPTALLPNGQPPGPRHLNPELFYYLGNSISGEAQAELGADADGNNNIRPNFDIADNDGGDDGLFLPNKLDHCARTQLRYRVRVSNLATGQIKAYVNMWFDWNRDGSWTPASTLACPGAGPAAEWAVQNHQITLPGPGSYILATPAFLAWNQKPTSDMWLRITLSDQPAPAADGRGPLAGYARGETEDYQLEGQPAAAIIPPDPGVSPIALDGPLAALSSFKVHLPLAVKPGTFDPGYTVPGGKLKELDVAHIGGSPDGPKPALLVSAVGTGATVKLSSWRLQAGQQAPLHLHDSPNIIGYDVKLHVLTPDVSPDLSYSLLISAVRDTQQNLWLTAWRLNDDGTFAELGTRGYGSNANVDVRAYAIAHRPLLRQDRTIDRFQVVTPVATTGGHLRLISWSVNPATGAINGLQDSGNWGDPADDTGLDAARLTGDSWTGPYYVVSHRNSDGILATNFWEVNAAGHPIPRGSGASGVDIRGDNTVTVGVQEQAIAPLTGTGFVSAHKNNSQLRISSWDNQRVFCSDTGCTLSPHFISDNAADLKPGNGIGIGLPAITSERALLADTLGANTLAGTETLFQKGNGQQGIASVTKMMTLILALDAVESGQAALNDVVEVSQAAADVGGSQMGLEAGEKQTLRTLLHGLMIVSGNDAALAIAEHIGGTQAAFATLMNTKAAALDMDDSIYCQAAGGCFSTPQDQVALWLSAYKDPQFQEFAGSDMYDACGLEEWEDKCYFLSRSVADRYPGMESWKGGSLGFFCGDVPDTVPLCASGGCLSAQVTRLSRTLALNQLHSQSAETAADRWNDAYDLFDYGYRQLFTPDFRGDSGAQGGPATDFAIDNVGDTRFVSAVLTPGGALKLCDWQVVAGIGQIGLLACAQRAYTNLPGGSQTLAPARIDILRLSTLESEGDYLSGHLESGNLTLRVWRVAERP
jgi:D-alanyl-D-alanine carboxypeptidase